MRLRNLALCVAVGSAVVAAGVAALVRRPELPDGPFTPEAASIISDSGIRVTFLGVSTLVISDGETNLITDGFFTRPSVRQMLFGKIAPDADVVDECLDRAGVHEAAAVLVAHSHFDHALDSPLVAQRTGAQLVGSRSTVQVGLGFGLPPEQMVEVVAGEPLKFGRFTVTMVLSEHSPHGKFRGSIDAPLRLPAKTSEFKMAECYAMLIEHTDASGLSHSLMINASAGFRPGMLNGLSADVAYLGIGTLGKQSAEFRDAYWRETVLATGVRRVIPIHWDDFTKPLSSPLVPMPYVADDMGESLRFLAERGARDGVDLEIPREWSVTDPFAGL
ncbi:MAG: hypothetical protein U0990_07700 [Candidatus Nanopelagicales bacterium]|nr:hypothetical protein [Candidatus Nanopelagicales bacterium]MDZ4249958.1 hypothetical protein [Candidatus Nanopelagicales bacterium]MDZ7578593.1 hypothetical protein [Candidatus Nanopelagicales bacterium]